MWADAQRDGRSANIGAESRKVWLTPIARVSCSNAANIGEHKTWTQSEFAYGKIALGGKSPRKCIYSVPSQDTAKRRAKFG